MANPKKASHPAYEALVARLLVDYSTITSGSLFGMPCLKSEGKAVIGAFDGGVVFRLAGEVHAAALALSGSELFDPSGKGRPMKAWVVVPKAHASEWMRLGEAALGA